MRNHLFSVACLLAAALLLYPVPMFASDAAAVCASAGKTQLFGSGVAQGVDTLFVRADTNAHFVISNDHQVGRMHHATCVRCENWLLSDSCLYSILSGPVTRPEPAAYLPLTLTAL